MKLDLNHARQLVRDAEAGHDPTEAEIAQHLNLVRALPELVEIALAAEKLVACKGRFHAEQNFEILKSKLQNLKELP